MTTSFGGRRIRILHRIENPGTIGIRIPIDNRYSFRDRGGGQTIRIEYLLAISIRIFSVITYPGDIGGSNIHSPSNIYPQHVFECLLATSVCGREGERGIECFIVSRIKDNRYSNIY